MERDPMIQTAYVAYHLKRIAIILVMALLEMITLFHQNVACHHKLIAPTHATVLTKMIPKVSAALPSILIVKTFVTVDIRTIPRESVALKVRSNAEFAMDH